MVDTLNRVLESVKEAEAAKMEKAGQKMQVITAKNIPEGTKLSIIEDLALQQGGEIIILNNNGSKEKIVWHNDDRYLPQSY